MRIYCNYNNTNADLETSPEPNEDPVSTEDPNDPTAMDADDNTDDEQVEVEPPTAAEIIQAGLQ